MTLSRAGGPGRRGTHAVAVTIMMLTVTVTRTRHGGGGETACQ